MPPPAIRLAAPIVLPSSTHEWILRKSASSVEAWSASRLPFQPRGSMTALRDALRTALRELSVEPGTGLDAVYAATSADRCDAENVLFYNVGMGALQHLMGDRVRFRRSYVNKPAPQELGTVSLDHYLSYRAIDDDRLDSGQTLATFDAARVASFASPASVWAPICRRGVSVLDSWAGDFAVQVTVRPPTRPVGTTTGLAPRLKTLLDGVISAFHNHTGEDLDEIASRLSQPGAATTQELRRWLGDDDGGALDRRRLVRPYRRGVQWNPADDRCVEADVRLLRDNTGHAADWTISGRLLAPDRSSASADSPAMRPPSRGSRRDPA